MNKKWIRSLLLLLTASLLTFSCQYDDRELWQEIEGIKKELKDIRGDLSAVRTVVEAQQKKKTIDDVRDIEGGYEIVFNDGKRVTVKNGMDAPVVNIKKGDDGIYYWTLDGEWLLDKEGKKVRVTGKDGQDGIDGQDGQDGTDGQNGQDGHSPELGIDDEGYWILDGERIKDKNGNEVQAVGNDGNSFFQSVQVKEESVVFILSNGDTIEIMKTGAGTFTILQPEGKLYWYTFNFDEEKTLQIKRANGIVTAEVTRVPEGWDAEIDLRRGTLSVTAPEKEAPTMKPGASNMDVVPYEWAKSYSGGIITLTGIDEKGETHFASVEVVASIDFTDKNGTFALCEGNMGSANGTVTFYDEDNIEYWDVFGQANQGKSLGNVVQDMYIANGYAYFITQNGRMDGLGGEGRFVVCDARTMKMIHADDLEFETPENVEAWPQHLVVPNDTLVYIQYASSDWESNSGIVKVSYKDGKVTNYGTVTGTYGEFSKSGTTKTRMLFSRGKVYAAQGEAAIIIDPATDEIIKRIDKTGHQAKGIAKGANGNIFIPFSATLTPFILEIDHSGNEVKTHELSEEIKFPVATWSPSVHFCASFNEPYLYFLDDDDFMALTASRYNYETGELDYQAVPKEMYGAVYGVMGVHPFTEELWMSRNVNFTMTRISVFDTSALPFVENRLYAYLDDDGASLAGFDFSYRFTEEWINK